MKGHYYYLARRDGKGINMYLIVGMRFKTLEEAEKAREDFQKRVDYKVYIILD